MAKILVAALASKADASVFEVAFETQADLCWYELPHRQQAEGDEEWCFVNYEADATFRVFWVKCATQADIKTFKVKYRDQAGWRNKGHKLRGQIG